MGILYDDAITSKGIPTVAILGRIATFAANCNINVADKDIRAISDEVEPLRTVSNSLLLCKSPFTYIGRVSQFEARNRTRF
jgi:hypothetical protein